MKEGGVLDEQVLEQLKADRTESIISNDSELEDSEENSDEVLSADKGEDSEVNVELDPEEMMLWEMEDCGDLGAEDNEDFGQVRKNRKGVMKAKDMGSGKASRKASIHRSGVRDDEIAFNGFEENESFASRGEGGSRRDRSIKRREGGAGRGFKKTRFGGQGRGSGGSGSSSSMGSQRFRERSVTQRGREGNSRTTRMPPPVRSSPFFKGRGINDQTVQVPQYRWDRIRESNAVADVEATGGINGEGHGSTRSRLPPKVATQSPEILDKEPHRRTEGGSK